MRPGPYKDLAAWSPKFRERKKLPQAATAQSLPPGLKRRCWLETTQKTQRTMTQKLPRSAFRLDAARRTNRSPAPRAIREENADARDHHARRHPPGAL